MYKTATGSSRAGGLPTDFHSKMTVEAIEKHLTPKTPRTRKSKKKEGENEVHNKNYTFYNNMVRL